MLNKMKVLASDQGFIRGWLERINETDEAVIQETVTAMRLNPEYREFILRYSMAGMNDNTGKEVELMDTSRGL